MNKFTQRLTGRLCQIMLIFSLSILSCLAEDKLTMNMRDADIRALIQWVADNTNKNIVVHKDVQGLVTVISSDTMTPSEAYQVFLSVLDIHGFAAIETAEAVKIVPKTIASSGLALDSNSSASADMVVSVFKLKHNAANSLINNVRPLVSKSAVLTTNNASNSLIIADHRANILRLKDLIAELDTLGDNDIDIITLKHANASDIMNTLQSFLPNQNNTGQPFAMSLDERSNSILLSGDQSKRIQFKTLIEKMDTQLSGDGNTQVIYLHYVDAKEIAPILSSLAKSIQSDSKNETSISNVSIESSETANALIINAPPGLLTTMKRVVDQLDIRRAQVLVEALVVEVSGDVAEDLGINWVTEDLSGVGDGVASAINTPGDLSLGGIVNDQYIAGPGMTFGYFNNGNIQAAIRALDATTKANILSTPTIVAIDNEEASLLVGQNVPFITGQSTNASSSTDNPFQTISRQDVGITLVVTPRINSGDSITLDIQQKTETIAPSVASASDLITNKREILTKALIKDDQMLVLGGLISDEETEKVEKVPFFGSLPLIGKLFSSTSTDHIKKNLMVFIHPVILKDDEHMTRVTQQRYQFMQNLRREAKEKTLTPKLRKRIDMEDFEAYKPIK